MTKKRTLKRNDLRYSQALLARVVDFVAVDAARVLDKASRQLVFDVAWGGPVPVLGLGLLAEIERWGASEFANLQLRLRQFFNALVPLKKTGLVPSLAVSQLTFFVATNDAGERVRLLVSGPTVEVVLFQVIQLLLVAGVGSLKRCPVEDCARLFARTGRRVFCSNRCQKRVYMREQRAEERASKMRLEANSRGRRTHGKATR